MNGGRKFTLVSGTTSEYGRHVKSPCRANRGEELQAAFWRTRRVGWTRESGSGCVSGAPMKTAKASTARHLEITRDEAATTLACPAGWRSPRGRGTSEVLDRCRIAVDALEPGCKEAHEKATTCTVFGIVLADE